MISTENVSKHENRKRRLSAENESLQRLKLQNSPLSCHIELPNHPPVVIRQTEHRITRDAYV
ncbi:hypothetical protein CANARDRAFT_29977, partial [[Candida] arabinofermentans NRRL YB-2248]